MKINYIKKDICSVTEGYVLHGVNCQGKMNSGIARAIRAKWPMIHAPYDALCSQYDATSLQGDIQIIEINPELSVINGFTQLNYGREKGIKYASIDNIDKVMQEIALLCKEEQRTLYMPYIGCGLGGLNWKEDVEPIIKKYRHKMDICICSLYK